MATRTTTKSRSFPRSLLRKDRLRPLSGEARSALLMILCHVKACGIGRVSATNAGIPHHQFTRAVDELNRAGLIRAVGPWIEVLEMTAVVPRGGLAEQLAQARAEMEREAAIEQTCAERDCYEPWVYELHTSLQTALGDRRDLSLSEVHGMAERYVEEYGEARVRAVCLEDAKAFVMRRRPGARSVWRLSVALANVDPASARVAAECASVGESSGQSLSARMYTSRRNQSGADAGTGAEADSQWMNAFLVDASDSIVGSASELAGSIPLDGEDF